MNFSFRALLIALHERLNKFIQFLKSRIFCTFMRSRFFKPFSGAHHGVTFARSWHVRNYRRSITDVDSLRLLREVEQRQMKAIKHDWLRGQGPLGLVTTHFQTSNEWLNSFFSNVDSVNLGIRTTVISSSTHLHTSRPISECNKCKCKSDQVFWLKMLLQLALLICCYIVEGAFF